MTTDVQVAAAARPHVAGKFLAAGDEQLRICGVTYGTFAGADQLPEPDTVAGDFAAIAASAINAVRVYTVPPRWLLDIAAEQGLRVLVGVPWEQHVSFLDDRERRRSIEHRMQSAVDACEGHPALLGFAIGNEIPPSIARWYGARRIERFLERLYTLAKREDPAALVTYASFPSTEYLELPFLDFASFNVYVERAEQFERYLGRLQTLAGDRPLVIGELGLDSDRHGGARQASVIDAQLRAAFDTGCAGAFAFAWTDEWCRDGEEVTGWSFGLVDRQRRPKAALAAVGEVYEQAQEGDLPELAETPRTSVVVCTFNGAATLAECLTAATALDYPDYEVIVIDDGSTDATATIADEHPVRLISTAQQGLSAARNAGIEAATGEIVAFIDDDCAPDPGWLRFAISSLTRSGHAGVGGPNLPPLSEPQVAACVAHAPGGPVHVLLSDTEAEHVAGCNMLFWKTALVAVGGFDHQFRQAGDDVDICWRIRDAGLTLGFSPAAVVWHRRRNTVRAYLRQQRSYGHAEALLERKWPERYNVDGHVSWRGRIYQTARRRRRVIDYGPGGTGLFQAAAEPRAPHAVAAALMPEWYLGILLLAVASVLAPWLPLLRVPGLGVPVAPLAAAAACLALGARAVIVAALLTRHGHTHRGSRATLLLAALVLLQPLARLDGRISHGLTPWRRRRGPRLGSLLPHTRSVWIEHGGSIGHRLAALETELRAMRAAVVRGGRFDRWDLGVRTGSMGAARIRIAIEEHGHGRQLIRYRIVARPTRRWLQVLAASLAAFALAALLGDAAAEIVFGAATSMIVLRTAADCTAASAAVNAALEGSR